MAVLGLAAIMNQGGRQGTPAPGPAPFVGGAGPLTPVAPGTFAPAVTDILGKARAAQAAAKVVAQEAERNATAGQQAAAAALRGDMGFTTSQGPMGAVAGDLARLQQGQAAPVGIAMSNGAQFAGLMQVNEAGGSMALNGTTTVQGGGWVTGRYTQSGTRATFVGTGMIPDKFSIEAQEEGAADGSGTEGVGVVRYANGERYEGQYRAVGTGAQSQYFRNGLGVHYGADERVINAGRFANDAYVGPQ